MADQAIIEVDSVSFGFRSNGAVRPVLHEISLSLFTSKTLAVTGPSGCGKTTLLRLMSGLLQPSSGEIRYFINENRRPRVGFMFQDYKLVPWLTVHDNLMFGHSLDQCDSTHFGEIIDLLGLRNHLRDYPARLSGGLKERTSLGRALLGRPDFLFLDEPLGSTDYVHRLEIEDYIYKRVHSDSIAALIVTHDLDQAIANADRIIVLAPVGSEHPAAVLDIPRDLRHFCPSQARLVPQMAPVMRNLIAKYESLL
jgi:NitT/TauT family transport system ATP-binding protein